MLGVAPVDAESNRRLVPSLELQPRRDDVARDLDAVSIAVGQPAPPRSRLATVRDARQSSGSDEARSATKSDR